MNLLAARVVLRPRSLADVLDLTIPFCLSNWRVIWRLFVTALLPIFALCLYVRLSRHWTWQQTWLLAVLLADAVEGLFTVAYGDLLFQPSAAVRTRAVWGRFLRRLGFTIGSLIVTRAILGILSVTMIGIPVALFLGVPFMFVREVGLLEGAQVFASIGRAYRFVQRQVLSCAGLLLAAVLAPALMACAAELLGDAIVEKMLQLGSPFGDFFKEGVSAYALFGFFLSVPVVAAARFLKYIDVRTRKEGWDIQLRFVSWKERSA